MQHIEQAKLLQQGIHNARFALSELCGDQPFESELQFRYDALMSLLVIMMQETKALIDNWAKVPVEQPDLAPRVDL